MQFLELTYADLRGLIGSHLGYGRTSGAWSTEKAAKIGQALDAGLRRFYSPEPVDGSRHRWSFLYPQTTLTTSAAYSTGTIEIASGVAALSVAGTFPAWAASGELTPRGSQTYTVASRDGDNQATLDDTSVTVAAGTAYSLGRVEYDLPIDFAGLESPFFYRPGINQIYPPVEEASYESIRRKRQAMGASAGWPRKVAIFNKTHDATVGTRWRAIFDFTPSAAWELTYRYKVQPAAIDGTDLYPYGGSQHSETILWLCLDAADEFFNEHKGRPHKEESLRRLTASIAEDQELAPDTLGYGGDPSDSLGHVLDPGANVLHAFNGTVYYD